MIKLVNAIKMAYLTFIVRNLDFKVLEMMKPLREAFSKGIVDSVDDSH